MGRSARRDLAALLRRHDAACSGVDLFVPARHLTSPETIDRAAEALFAAAELAGELGQLTGGHPVLATSLPPRDAEDAPASSTLEQLVPALVDHAAASGAVIADHAWPGGGWDDAGVKRGLDPANVILRGDKAAGAVARLSQTPGSLVAIRVADLTADGRVEPGVGELDLFSFVVACMTAARDAAPLPLVVDLRGVHDPPGGLHSAARRACERLGADTTDA
jgi:sugar phosphate isomerase/epimerase